MILSYQWLQDYIPESVSIKDIEHILTSVGLEVEAVELVEQIKGSLAGLVVGKVLVCEPHPNADRLRVTKVDIGTNTPIQIVCGAPNVAAGQTVIVALPGTTIYPIQGDSITLKKASIRGVESMGMICAAAEIGVSQDADGIMILPSEIQAGTPAAAYFKLPEPDYAIHIGLTPNRSDAMCHMGAARDIVAWLNYHRKAGIELKKPATLPLKGNARIPMKVTIDAPSACKRYAGICISGITVGASPEWLQQRLKSIGLRPVNNVVDITNYVLFEYGHPLHAFDASCIHDNHIRVGFLSGGTEFTTLDGNKIKLTAEDLMICDTQGPLCMAGVYGGISSGVKEHTTQIFLESAWFDPISIRRSSLHHNLRTDAASRFEKGADISILIPALKRAISLILEICGGEISSDLLDVYPEEVAPKVIDVQTEYIQRIAGKAYADAEITSILNDLGFTVNASKQGNFLVIVPHAKNDVCQQADVVEELLRIDGLDNIPMPDVMHVTIPQTLPSDRKQKEILSNYIAGMGFQEIITNSLTNSKYYPDRTDLVTLMNSISNELDILRPSMIESGLEVIAYNCNRKNKDLCLFEFGTIYIKNGDKHEEIPQLVLFMTGQTSPTSWDKKPLPASIFHLKGIVQSLLDSSGIKKAILQYTDTEMIWNYKKKNLCSVQRIAKSSLDKFDIRQDVFVAIINWKQWLEASQDAKITYKEVPKFPLVERDLALLLDKSIPYQKVEEATKSLKLEALKHFRLFDVFESEKIGKDKKSYAINYTFQLQDRTLTDAETESMMQSLIQVYKTQLDAQIRE